MKTLTPLIEDCREFKPLSRLRCATPRSTDRNRERSTHIRNPQPAAIRRATWDEREIVASFGKADLIRHYNGSWELQGGSPTDHAAAREWCAHFQHEATFPSPPLPLTTPQSKAASTVHNRILIADDDALVRGSLAAVLESEGFVVDEAQNGIEAVTRAIEHKPDVVLLDLNMPHWDGWTAFSQLDRVTPLLPVIVITARPNQYEKAVKLGVDAFMEKPLNIAILVGAIKRLTREDEQRHVRRITNRSFVTQLLGSNES
jgi:CheY-like chemotaxis protein